ncbi:MAG: methylenetetrahydrofolate reductase C-terminal domain-containing protein, partial [Candidatus Hydrogenedentes bacterium]|nr:methylenetetrahydrofolate reductase C-terminal domain-containing protein [Candidatus Hydrogenedentota bacterium]
ECGWQLIYERLKKLGGLDKMKTIVEPKDYSKMEVPESIRPTAKWALEQREEETVTR